jgi:hypothetical protein
VLAGYWLCALVTHTSGLWQPMHADYSCWLRVARDWRDGATLYRDTYDNKLPWLYRWVRAADSSRPEISGYLAETVLAAVAATIFRSALRPAMPRVASLAPLLVIVWSGTSSSFYGGQSTEAVALWFDVAALSLWALAALRGSAAWAFVAGACFFVEAVFRPPALVHLAAWLPFGWFAFQRHSQAVAGRVLAAAVAGWLLMLALLGIDSLASGHGPELLVVLARNRDYATRSELPLAASLVTGAARVVRLLAENPAAVLLVGMSAVVAWFRWRHTARRERAWWLAATLWLLAAVTGALPGGRHYLHYYHFLWGPLGLLSTLWLSGSWHGAEARRLQRRLVVGVVVGSLAAALLQQGFQAARAVRGDQQPDQSRAALAEAATYLAQQTAPDVNVLVHVWGDWAELYWRVPRPACSYSIPHVLPADLFGPWQAAVLAEPPRFIVWDGTPWQPLDRPADTASAARWTAWLTEQYAPIERFDGLTIYRRNDP